MSKNTPFVRHPYNYDVNQASDESGLHCKDKTRTIQSQSAETDINNIVEKFIRTGELPQSNRMPQFADFTGIGDFHSAANAIAQAHEAFDELPAKIRARFNNDPGEFVDFCLDDKNIPEARSLGLIPVERHETLTLNSQGARQEGGTLTPELNAGAGHEPPAKGEPGAAPQTPQKLTPKK